jgi:hypothetical protein
MMMMMMMMMMTTTTIIIIIIIIIITIIIQYYGTALTNQNDIHHEIKSGLNSGNACYYSVQNLLSCRLASENLKIKIHKTVILPVVLYGCETWSLTVTEVQRLSVFENSVEDIWT